MIKVTNENGTIVIVALVILAASSLIGVISSNITQTELALTNAYVQQKKAFYAAESGLNYAVTMVASITDRPDDPHWSKALAGTLPTGEKFSVVMRHKVANGQVVKWGDTNKDFVFEECTACPGKPIERIVSTGFSRGGSQQSVATEVFAEPLFPDVAAALYVGGTSLESYGTSSITEGEYGYVADKAACQEVADIITTSAALDGFQATDFKGRTGLRSTLLNDEKPYPVARVVDNLKERAMAVAPANDLVLGSSDNYGLFYCSGNFDVNNLSGYGMLLIEGSAVISGTFSWQGLIITKGDTQLSGGGSKEIIGAFVSGGRVRIDGSAEFYYDCRELNRIRDKFSRYVKRFWAYAVFDNL